mmetsp:Transcript_12122/g.19292  ORF Transcript_12122/g.19292 Transcript_12122/m.19292 type:complete len:81 (-) Transcript_12122:676-918(-)
MYKYPPIMCVNSLVKPKDTQAQKNAILWAFKLCGFSLYKANARNVGCSIHAKRICGSPSAMLIVLGGTWTMRNTVARAQI